MLSPGSALSRGAPLIADNNGLLFVETSALDSTNVEQAFETILKGTCTSAVLRRGPGDRGITGSLTGDAGLGRGRAAYLLCPAPHELFGAGFGVVFLAGLVSGLWCWAFHSPHPMALFIWPLGVPKAPGAPSPPVIPGLPSCCPGLLTQCLQHPAEPAVGTWGDVDGEG